MRRISQLITQSRRATENLSFDENSGISTDEFIQYSNDGQDRIQSLIATAQEEMFQKEIIIDSVSGQEAYDLPDDTLMSTRVQNVEYSDSGGNLYYRLSQGRMKERISSNIISNIPGFYIRRSSQLLLQPTPSGGGLIRITYQYKLPKLDIRRAKVDSATFTGNTIDTLFLDTTSNIDSEEIKDEAYITIVDKDGIIKMQKIPVQDINTTSGEVTVYPGFEFEDGETIDPGDWVVLGKMATTHSELPDICEKYLISYMNWKILKRDSSNDSVEQNAELKEMENEIVSAFALADQDVDGITILNSDFASIDDDDWF